MLLMAEYAYKNPKNANPGHILFQFNCGYYSKVLFKKDVDSCLSSCFTDKLAKELKKLIEICCQNLLYVQKLQ